MADTISSNSSNSLQMTSSPASRTTEDTVAIVSPTKKKTARFSVANVTSTDSAEASRKNSDSDIPELSDYGHNNGDTHQKSQHSATYNTMYLKSLRHYLTRDVLPAEHNYRNILSFTGQHNILDKRRPTLDELHEDNNELRQELLKKTQDAKVEQIARVLLSYVLVSFHPDSGCPFIFAKIIGFLHNILLRRQRFPPEFLNISQFFPRF